MIVPIRWNEAGGCVEFLDQLSLPAVVRWIACCDESAVANAIRMMVVRGAPAIGIAAAYGMALSAREGSVENVRRAAQLLGESRPTAVNLRWAIEQCLASIEGIDPSRMFWKLLITARNIHDDDIRNNRRMGLLGQTLLPATSTILTHCNAGALATGGFGTALGVIRAARESGKSVAVFADETRPYLQGARLTAWELQRDGFDVTLITDSMAGHFFRAGSFDAVIVGADRIAANGDTANKVGTYTLAVLARAHNTPFYVAAPRSTIDLRCPSGDQIPIEERASDEVTVARGFDRDDVLRELRFAPDGVRARHPAFDVTPAELITRIITEDQILEPPFSESIRKAFAHEAAVTL